jgi:ribonuclease HI
MFPRPELVRPSFKKPPHRGGKDGEAELFKEWLRERNEEEELIVYSDGSQLQEKGHKRTGWGFTIRKGGTTQEVYRNRGRLHRAEVFDAEVHGALQGLAAARTIGPNKRLFVCLDNTSVVDGLNGSPPESSQAIFLRFQELASGHSPGVTVKWIPGHQDIEGNEAADKLAKEGAMLETRIDSLPTVAWVRRHLKGKRKDDFARWWAAQDEARYEDVHSYAAVSKNLVSFKRATLHRLLAARSGHGDFAAYHERFGHTDSNKHCTCGERKTPEHIFFCRKLQDTDCSRGTRQGRLIHNIWGRRVRSGRVL